MAKEKKAYQEIEEFVDLSKQIVYKYPEKFGNITVDDIVCYGIINKKKPEKKRELFSISAGKEPEVFTNSKRIFVEFYQDFWDSRTVEQKQWLVYTALRRIDGVESPPKILPMGYKDDEECVRTLGPDWEYSEKLPNLLTDKVTFRK